MGKYGGIVQLKDIGDMAGYSEIQRDTAGYSWIQHDTAGNSGIQRDTAGVTIQILGNPAVAMRGPRPVIYESCVSTVQLFWNIWARTVVVCMLSGPCACVLVE